MPYPGLKHIPTDLSNYSEIANIFVQRDGLALEHVPKDHADFGEIAKIAVQDRGNHAA